MRKRRALGGSLAMFEGEEESNPMDGVANLSDVMLVFACGLMMALLLNWNVKLNVVDVDRSQLQSVPENMEIVQATAQASSSSGGGFNELGTVYEDLETGKMYMIVGN